MNAGSKIFGAGSKYEYHSCNTGGGVLGRPAGKTCANKVARGRRMRSEFVHPLTLCVLFAAACALFAAAQFVPYAIEYDLIYDAGHISDGLLPAAYGHGLGLDRVSPVEGVGQNKIVLLVEMPQSLTGGGTERIVISAVDDITDQNVANITYLLGISHDGRTILRDYFFARDGLLYLDVATTAAAAALQADPLVIEGVQDGPLDAWRPAKGDSVKIYNSGFGSSGLYTFDLAVYSIGDDVFDEPVTHYADLSVVESVLHDAVDSNDDHVTFGTRSYFDGVEGLVYDYMLGEVSFVMPFDWSEARMSHIPVVHVETHFPKEFLEFHSLGYVGHVNDIKLFKSSIVIDDYTMDGERIVHFILLQDHLRFVKNELKKSGEPLPDHMTFRLTKTDTFDFPLVAYTISEDFLVNLSWEPRELEPGKETTFVFTIRDGKTGEPLRDSDYTFVIEQNNETIYKTTGQARIGGQFVKFTFGENQTGPTTIKFEDIRGTGQETEFGILVIPEFTPLVIASILAGVTAAVVVLTRVFNFGMAASATATATATTAIMATTTQDAHAAPLQSVS